MRSNPSSLEEHRREISALVDLVNTDEAKAKKFAALQPVLRARSKKLFNAVWAPSAKAEAHEIAAEYRDLAERFGQTDEDQEESFASWQAALRAMRT